MGYNSLSDIWAYFDVVERKRFSSHDIIAALSELPKEGSEAELCRFESLAFSFITHKGRNEWGTYYASQCTFTKKDTGEKVHVPDIKYITPEIIAYWETRAAKVVNPLLKMRYTGLVYDFKWKVSHEKPDYKSICKANVEAIIDVVNGDYPRYETVELDYAARALQLAIQFKNTDLQQRVVDAYYNAHKRLATDDSKSGIWGIIVQSMISHRDLFDRYEVDLFAENLQRLMRLEKQALTEGAQTDRYAHIMEDQVDILCEYYRTIRENDRIENLLDRLLLCLKKSIPIRGGMWGQIMLEQMQARYRKYNLNKKANKLYLEISDLGRLALKEMKPVEYSIPIDGKVVESFLQEAVRGTLQEAIVRYIVEYIPIRQEEIRQQKENAEKYPLMYMVETVTIDSSGNTINRIGVGKDADEQKLHHSMYENIKFATPQMHLHMGRLRQEKQLTLESLLELFDGSPLITEDNRDFLVKGFEAYLNGENMICCHVLIPLFEALLRRLMEMNGASILCAQQDPKEGNRYLSLDGLLDSNVAKECLKEDLITYFRVLYVSPSGWNLRNLVSHGLLPSDSFNYMMSDRVVHSILILSQFRVKE